MARDKAILLVVVLGLGLLVGVGFDWMELRYVEYAFERDCPDQHPAAICSVVVERVGATCREESRSPHKNRPVIPRRYRVCLFTAASVTTSAHENRVNVPDDAEPESEERKAEQLEPTAREAPGAER